MGSGHGEHPTGFLNSGHEARCGGCSRHRVGRARRRLTHGELRNGHRGGVGGQLSQAGDVHADVWQLLSACLIVCILSCCIKLLMFVPAVKFWHFIVGV